MQFVNMLALASWNWYSPSDPYFFFTAAEREAQIEAFLDQIEGETLGEMMNYLSSELESTTIGHFEAAAAALESTVTSGDGGGGNVSTDDLSKGDNKDMVPTAATTTATKKEKEEEDKIYNEITKLTRSTVDRYTKELLLNTIMAI